MQQLLRLVSGRAFRDFNRKVGIEIGACFNARHITARLANYTARRDTTIERVVHMSMDPEIGLAGYEAALTATL